VSGGRKCADAKNELQELLQILLRLFFASNL
jgi:hypothetical protein